MWHASVAPTRYHLTAQVTECLALGALEGVGDVALGQWVERTPRAVHVRRRLSEAEALVTGPAIDLRQSVEARERFEAAKDSLPRMVVLMALQEIGEPPA